MIDFRLVRQQHRDETAEANWHEFVAQQKTLAYAWQNKYWMTGAAAIVGLIWAFFFDGGLPLLLGGLFILGWGAIYYRFEKPVYFLKIWKELESASPNEQPPLMRRILTEPPMIIFSLLQSVFFTVWVSNSLMIKLLTMPFSNESLFLIGAMLILFLISFLLWYAYKKNERKSNLDIINRYEAGMHI
jgi:hypothetical protein